MCVRMHVYLLSAIPNDLWPLLDDLLIRLRANSTRGSLPTIGEAVLPQPQVGQHC